MKFLYILQVLILLFFFRIISDREFCLAFSLTIFMLTILWAIFVNILNHKMVVC